MLGTDKNLLYTRTGVRAFGGAGACMRLFQSLLLTLPAIGCSDYATGQEEISAGAPEQGEADGSDLHDSASEVDAPVPAWYTIEGTVHVVDREAQTAGAALNFVLADAELQSWACTALDLSALVVAIPPVLDTEIYAWWELNGASESGCGDVVGLPERFGFGLGELSPEIRARLGSVGQQDSADTLYGAWMVVDSNLDGSLADEIEAFPFGYADGAGDSLAGEFPADDSYALQPMLVMELAPQE